jgi:hypothetical protein
MNKPPLGVMPKWLYDELKPYNATLRLHDLKRAIDEYRNAQLPIDPKWIEEYNELVKKEAE